jgi:hypothetical protein
MQPDEPQAKPPAVFHLEGLIQMTQAAFYFTLPFFGFYFKSHEPGRF